MGGVTLLEPCRRRLFGGTAFEAIVFAGEGEDLGVLQEPVEDRDGGRDVADQLVQVFDRSVVQRSSS